MIAAELEASQELSQRVLRFIRDSELEYKQRDRFERYPRQISSREAIEGVLKDVNLDAFTAELLIKELGRTGEHCAARQTIGQGNIEHNHAHISTIMH